jgi:integrase
MSNPFEIRKRSTRGAGSVFEYPRGSGRWSIQYYAPTYVPATGQTRSLRKREYCGLPKAQAQKLLNDRVGRLARGEQFDAGKPRTVAELYHALRTFTANNSKPGSRTVKGLEWRWKKLAPHFAAVRAPAVTSASIEEYKRLRKAAGAANATVNRELAMLRRMFRYGRQCTPPLVYSVPHFAMFSEKDNVRKGFIEDHQFDCLCEEAAKDGLWMRLLVELAYTYGWRRGELMQLRVRHVDLRNRTIRLDPGTTKNTEGREVHVGNDNLLELLRAACEGKRGEDPLFTRDDGCEVRSMSAAFRNLCVRAGVGRWECDRKCGATPTGKRCRCGGRRKYVGLLVHDFRRSAAKALRRAGVPESVIMATGGWKTAAMFRRYAIVSSADQKAAMEALEAARRKNSPPNSPPNSPRTVKMDRNSEGEEVSTIQ